MGMRHDIIKLGFKCAFDSPHHWAILASLGWVHIYVQRSYAILSTWAGSVFADCISAVCSFDSDPASGQAGYARARGLLIILAYVVSLFFASWANGRKGVPCVGRDCGQHIVQYLGHCVFVDGSTIVASSMPDVKPWLKALLLQQHMLEFKPTTTSRPGPQTACIGLWGAARHQRSW